MFDVEADMRGEKMGDWIDRAEAIKTIGLITSNMSVCINKDECHGMKRMQRQAVLEITNMPSAQPEPSTEIMERSSQYYHDGWIPCNERLPNKTDCYITTLKDDIGYFVCPIDWNESFGGRWQDVFYDNDPYGEYRDVSNVIAWMPLPEPYKPKEASK